MYYQSSVSIARADVYVFWAHGDSIRVDADGTVHSPTFVDIHAEACAAFQS